MPPCASTSLSVFLPETARPSGARPEGGQRGNPAKVRYRNDSVAVPQARPIAISGMCPVLCPISIGSGIGRYQGDARSGRRKSLSAMGLAHTREISTYMVEAVGSTTYKPGVAGSKPAPPTNKIKGFSAIPAVQPDFWIPNWILQAFLPQPLRQINRASPDLFSWPPRPA